MSLRINTNISALNAHKNMINTDSKLSRSLERLSSGLRINRAADDASGMAIADSLKAQALGLGQAIKNGNDGIAVVQVADGALEEYINIINTVRTKSIQASSDGQNTTSRLAIQADISKLIEQADNIAKTTAFNGLNLLDGSYVDKNFHVGAYANETVSVSIDSARTNAMGKFAYETGTTVTTTDLISGALTINGVDTGAGVVGTDNALAQELDSAWVKMNAVNSVQSQTGVTATASTSVVGAADIAGGTFSAGDVYINGIDLGDVTFSAQDSTGTLVAAVNKISDQTGVSASVVEGGKIEFSSEDGQNIYLSSAADGTGALAAGDATSLGITNASVNDASAGALAIQNQGVITLESDKAIIIAGTASDVAGLTDGTITTGNSLASVDVTTRDAAELSIRKADHALAQLGTIRSGLGSSQNQIESTVRNISVTRVNIYAAESAIRDVDFAEESATFAKYQILAQAGSFAMAQSNAVQQNVLSLLQ